MMSKGCPVMGISLRLLLLQKSTPDKEALISIRI
jgi:hypothetical protein